MAKEHVAEVADCAGVVLLSDKLVPQKVSNLFHCRDGVGLGPAPRVIFGCQVSIRHIEKGREDVPEKSQQDAFKVAGSRHLIGLNLNRGQVFRVCISSSAEPIHFLQRLCVGMVLVSSYTQVRKGHGVLAIGANAVGLHTG